MHIANVTINILQFLFVFVFSMSNSTSHFIITTNSHVFFEIHPILFNKIKGRRRKCVRQLNAAFFVLVTSDRIIGRLLFNRTFFVVVANSLLIDFCRLSHAAAIGH